MTGLPTTLDLLAAGRLAVDGGLMVLIWLVQIVIYPSFLYADPDKLVHWHTVYTGRISMIVMPLMFLQLGLIALQLSARADIWVLAAATLVALCWVSTFLLSVPLHGRISSGEIDPEVLQALVSTNWPRTVAWTLCFLTAWMSFLSRSGS